MKNRALLLLMITGLMVLAGYGVSVVIECNALSTKQLFCAKIKVLPTYYEDNIRGHLFAGFLALGGFLLSLKTFIVVNMKENVYDDEKYQENWASQSKHDSSLKLYGPLKELSDLLFFAILATIISAALQMSLGLYQHWLASILCIWSAIYAIALLVSSLILIKQNLDTWFAHLDD